MSGFLTTHWECETAETVFRCPRCAGPREGTRHAVRARIALLGRPLGWFGRATTYLTCGDCGRSWEAVGDTAPADAVSEDERALRAVVAAVVFSDLSIRSTEKRMVGRVVERYTGEALDEVGVEHLLRTARARWGDPLARLGRLAAVLDPRAKRRIVGAAYLVCTADREVHPEESRLLVRIGEALDMAPREVRAAIEEAKGGAPAR